MPESEFSPTFMPDGKNISSVLIEKDSTQRLWKFPILGGPASLALDKIDSVGYHCWINKNKIAFFVLTQPFTLQVVTTTVQQAQIIDDSIGRCTQNIPMRNALSYTVKQNDSTIFIRQYKFDVKPSKTIFDVVMKNYRTINRSEDYTWLNENTLIMGSGSTLYKSCVDCKNESGAWTIIQDLKQFGIDKIGRIAISANKKRIALVTTQ